VPPGSGWRKTVEGESWTTTSGYASLRWRAGDKFALNGGFNSRRSTRLYRDLVSPPTEFADRYRCEFWIGADATTLTLGLRRLTTISLDLATRSTRYTNAQLEGWLHPLSIFASLTIRIGHGLAVARSVRRIVKAGGRW
jgi:hypothetical protein